MEYKIGTAAKMLGVSPDLLRYYEKKGVVRPRKDEKNDYRYYEAWDISTLLECLWYRGFGFSIDEVSHIVSGDSYETISGELESREKLLEESIHRQTLLLERLRLHRREMERGRRLLGICDVVQSMETICYMNRHNFAYDEEPEMIRLTQSWLKYIPFVRRCFEVRLDDLNTVEIEENFSWGLSLDPEYTREFPVYIREPVRLLPSRRCVHSVFKSTGKEAFSPRNLRFMLEYAEENGLTVCGNAYGNLLCSAFEDDGQTGYFEVWIPVE